jgi:uncharacterized OB-fold protein
MAFKVNTIPILTQEMLISTNQVSSMVFRPKKLEIRKRKCENCEKSPFPPKNPCHEIESNPSKDRIVHEGNIPSM